MATNDADRQTLRDGQCETSSITRLVVGVDQLKVESPEHQRHESDSLNGRKLLAKAYKLGKNEHTMISLSAATSQHKKDNTPARVSG
jgi:hypothetical protein